MSSSNPPPRPPFSALPLDPSGPPGNAWSLYGPRDELGALNILTPGVVKRAAAEEIRTGIRVSLDWSLNLPTYPSFGRPPFTWKMKNRAHPDGRKRTVNDDFLYDWNTQSSSQWDGFKHYGYQSRKVYYGGRGQDDVEGKSATGEDEGVLGIDRVAEAGGVTTRGVILDYPRWCEKNGVTAKEPLGANSIDAATLEAMLDDTGVQTREGDLLLLRTGFTKAYLKLDMQQRKELAGRPPAFLGVESSKSVLKWIWESGFVAVAGDAPSFEMSPIVGEHTAKGGLWKGESWEEEMQGGGLVHQWCLGGWGVMIGEMWDLEKLCAKAEELGRWTCFVSSVPMKIPGGVASPPNAVAIF